MFTASPASPPSFVVASQPTFCDCHLQESVGLRLQTNVTNTFTNNNMSYDRTYRKTTTRSTRRPNYIPPPPPLASHGHSVLGYWVPLVAIGTLAVGGLAAWVWSERSENDEDDDYPDEKPPRPSSGPGSGPYPPSYTSQQQQQPTGILPHQRPDYVPPPAGGEQYGGAASSYYAEASSQSRSTEQQRTDGTFFTRMSGAIRRTPSPQQFFDSASRQVAAAGAAAGAALSSIMEVDSNGDRQERVRRDERDGFSDHERWSEEAEELSKSNSKGKGKAKRTVAIVLSAESSYTADDDEDFHTEHGVSSCPCSISLIRLTP